MIRRHQLLVCALLFPVSTCMNSCGGGGASGNTLTGQFTDSPVENLRYSTPTFSGRTNSNGEFHYIAGESVSFFVGDIALGSTTGKAMITPFDLAGMSIPTTKSQIWAMQRKLRRSKLYPMHKVINISAFLQTIDNDGDPSNGISIPEEVHAIATGMHIDFNKAAFYYTERPTIGEPSDLLFRDTFQLGILLAQGIKQGLWSGRRHLTQAHIALANLYAGFGITPVMDQVKEFYIKVPGNPSVLPIYSYTYDLAGNRDFLQADFGADGVIDKVTIYDYDANQNLKSKLTSQTNNGPIIMSVKYEYDDYSNFIHTIHDESAKKWEVQYLYNSYGKESFRRSDHNGDGIAVQVLLSHWSDDGYLTSTETNSNDNGVIDDISYYQYDTRGNAILNTVDSNADGVIDYTTAITNQYDAYGNLMLVQKDFEDNGSIDSVIKHEYNANGQLTLHESDENNDGIPESVFRYEYDTQGNLTLKQQDIDGDGIYEFHDHYMFDEAGNLSTQEIDIDGDGAFDNLTRYTSYDVDGNVLKIEFDTDGDGIIDYYLNYSYTNGFITLHSEHSASTNEIMQEYINVPIETSVPWREIVAIYPWDE